MLHISLLLGGILLQFILYLCCILLWLGTPKWANIKHRKGAQDAKRGKIFGQLSKLIQVAAKQGPDPDSNPTLRTAIEKARAVNMPSANIERAIAKATGAGGEALESFTLEAFGVEGVAFLIDVATDNRNRTVADIRAILNKSGGRLGESGSAAWMFSAVGEITVDANVWSDDIELEAVDHGLTDTLEVEDRIVLLVEPTQFQACKDFLASKSIEIKDQQLTHKPNDPLEAGDEVYSKTAALIEKIEDNDDVVAVATNLA